MRFLPNRRARAAAALAAVALIAASCGGGDDDSSTGQTGTDGSVAESDGTAVTSGSSEADDQQCTPDRAGGKLVAMTNSANTGLDPTLMQGTGAYGGDVAGAFYGTVIRYDATTDEYQPSIAESWDANADNTEWTVQLRNDVKFGNGDPFTSEHIAAHLERLAGTSVRAAGMAALVENVEIVNDYELVATLSKPADFRYMMASEPGWVPNNNLVQERGDNFHGNPKGAGAGAFEFKSMSATPGESLVLTSKDDWWGGDVCLDEIEYTHAAEISTQADAFRTGEVDTWLVGDQELAAEFDEQGLMAHQVPTGTMGYVTMNQGFEGEETKFDDVRIREAMHLSINYDVFYERLFSGLGPKPTSALVPEESSLYPGIDGPPYDPERARELVQETIDEGVWDGSLTLTHTPSQDQTETAVLLEGMWEAVGIDVTLDPAEDAVTRIIVDHNFEVATLGFGIVPPQPWSTLNGLECDSPRTRSGFCDANMDAALEASRNAVTLDEQREAMGQLQEVWNRTYPLIVYRHGTFGYAAQSDVHGLEFGPDYTPYFANAWIEG